MYRLLALLPQGSFYRDDQLLDDEAAAKALQKEIAEKRIRDALKDDSEELDEAGEPVLSKRSSVGHDQSISLLMTLCELIQQLNSTLIGVNLPKGKRPPKVRPMPRPVGALDVLRAQHERAQVDKALDDLFTGLEITDIGEE